MNNIPTLQRTDPTYLRRQNRNRFEYEEKGWNRGKNLRIYWFIHRRNQSTKTHRI